MTKRIRSACYLEKQRKTKSEQYKNRRNSAIELLGGKCIECSCAEDLHFDHIDMFSKSFPISRAPSDKLFWEELKKCQLLCNKCHRKKSNKENSGELCHAAKLSHEDVKIIFIKLSSGISQNKIAKQFNVSPMQISRIKNGTRWRHMTDET